VQELTRLVSSADDYHDWASDESPASLDPLGRWFVGCVEVVAWTDEEMQEEKRKLVIDVPLSPYRLSDRTISIASDCGMYFGHVVLKNIAGTHWTQVSTGKSNMDYGHPVSVVSAVRN
jgi:hypothetical protein